MIRLFIASCLVFCGGVVLHAVLTHLIHSRNYVRNGYLLFVGMCLAAIPLALRLGLVGALVLYVALTILWNSYLLFFINLMNSVSLRMMGEIDRSTTGNLSLAEIESSWSDTDALESRLQALAHNGFIVDDGAHGLRVTPRGRSFAWVLEVIRRTIGIESFG